MLANIKISYANFLKGLFAIMVLCVAKFFDLEDSLLPFVISACGSSGGGGSSGGSSGGSGGGSNCANSSGNSSAQSGGYGAGMSTGENSHGNNPSGMQSGGGVSSSGGSSSSSGGGSTPFLCTWNGEKFQFENDILFGKPVSLFFSKEAGLEAYKKGNVVGDCYKISNSMIPKDGSISFQIKEIEPEESFIDYLSLLRVTYPKNGRLIMGSDFKTIFVFDEKSIQDKKGVSDISFKDKKGADISECFAIFDEKKGNAGAYVMEDQDVIEIKGKVDDVTKPSYLLIGSHYRDWTLGRVIKSNDSATIRKQIFDVWAESRSLKSFISGTAKVAVLSFMLGVIWLTGVVQTFVSSGVASNTTDDAHTLANIFGIKSAHADIPYSGGKNSLIVEYSDGVQQHRVDVIQPRCYQKTLETVCIPAEAISASGEFSLKITATRKHDVSDLVLISSDETLPFESSVLPVTKAFHQREKRDYARTLNEKMSGEYLHTLPSDIVDIEFGPVAVDANNPDENEAYLIQAHGFYTPVLDESQKIVGDWVAKLDTESREILGKMYTLEDYQTKERTTVI